MSDLVGTPNCWFSHAQAQITSVNHSSYTLIYPALLQSRRAVVRKKGHNVRVLSYSNLVLFLYIRIIYFKTEIQFVFGHVLTSVCLPSMTFRKGLTIGIKCRFTLGWGLFLFKVDFYPTFKAVTACRR